MHLTQNRQIGIEPPTCGAQTGIGVPPARPGNDRLKVAKVTWFGPSSAHIESVPRRVPTDAASRFLRALAASRLVHMTWRPRCAITFRTPRITGNASRITGNMPRITGNTPRPACLAPRIAGNMPRITGNAPHITRNARPADRDARDRPNTHSCHKPRSDHYLWHAAARRRVATVPLFSAPGVAPLLRSPMQPRFSFESAICRSQAFTRYVPDLRGVASRHKLRYSTCHFSRRCCRGFGIRVARFGLKLTRGRRWDISRQVEASEQASSYTKQILDW